jgi:hypothetical protein
VGFSFLNISELENWFVPVLEKIKKESTVPVISKTLKNQ